MRAIFVTLSLICVFVSGFAQTDTTNGFIAPAKVSGNARDLALYLCDGVYSDSLKANLIFNWITHNIEFDIKAAKEPNRPPVVVADVLKNKKAVGDGYAALYEEMCEAVGLEAVRIDGYVKDWKFDNGDKLYIPRHEWCAVMIDRRWELVDPTFGAGGISRAPGWFRTQLNRFSKEKIIYSKKEVFEFRYSPQYFMMNPMDFRRSHLPADPLWQLAKAPLPLEIFESGDTAILEFNATNDGRVNRAAELEYIARLNEEQKLKEASDRIYKFNKRFPAILAIKEQLHTAEQLAKYASRRHVPPRSTYEDAYRGMVLAKGYLEQQSSYMPEHYNELKKKNIAKNKDANDRIRRIRVHNKTLTSQCRMHAAAAQRKYDALDKKQGRADAASARISSGRIDSIKTTAVPKEANDPSLLVIADTIAAKNKRLKASNMQVIDKMQAITILQDENRALSDMLSRLVPYSDTVLGFETEARLNFRDSYDDDVKFLMQVFEQLRFNEGDSIQKAYFNNFDTLVVYYEDLLKIYLQQADLYKSSLRDMEQYRRWNNTNESIVSSYVNACKGYSDCLAQYLQNMDVYSNYLADNKNAFETMAKMYEEELDLLDRMEEGETARKEAEETELNENKSFDERENDRQQQQAKEMLDTLTEILSK